MSLGDTRARMTGSDRRDNLGFEVKVSSSSSSYLLLLLLLLLCAGAPAFTREEYRDPKPLSRGSPDWDIDEAYTVTYGPHISTYSTYIVTYTVANFANALANSAIVAS